MYYYMLVCFMWLRYIFEFGHQIQIIINMVKFGLQIQIIMNTCEFGGQIKVINKHGKINAKWQKQFAGGRLKDPPSQNASVLEGALRRPPALTSLYRRQAPASTNGHLCWLKGVGGCCACQHKPV
jgi:hypothetical protein